MGRTSIGWTDFSWNPARGCTRVSAGCVHCYAEVMTERWQPAKAHDIPLGSDGVLHVPGETKGETRQRQIQRAVSDILQGELGFVPHAAGLRTSIAFARGWPLPNVWLGTSVENQAAAGERIPELRETPAAVRFLSCEPLLGPLVLFDTSEGVPRGPAIIRSGGVTASTPHAPSEGYDDSYSGIDWIIAGAESGHGARACNLEWVRAIRDQCVAAGVPFFFKQMLDERGRKIEAPMLDGRQWQQFPQTE